jgi:hypothetical protein
MGNNSFHVHFIYIFHRINLSSLVVEEFLKAVAKNAAQGVRHDALLVSVQDT